MVLMVGRSDEDNFALLLNILFLLSPENKDMEAIFLVRNVMVLLTELAKRRRTYFKLQLSTALGFALLIPGR